MYIYSADCAVRIMDNNLVFLIGTPINVRGVVSVAVLDLRLILFVNLSAKTKTVAGTRFIAVAYQFRVCVRACNVCVYIDLLIK